MFTRSGINQEKETPDKHQSKETNPGYTTEKSEAENIPPQKKTQELHIWDHPISKLYTDDYGRFPTQPRIGNEYIMIAYHCDSNTILQSHFVNRKYKHRIRAYNYIMQILADRGNHVEVQILDNEVSEEFKKTIEKDWGAS